METGFSVADAMTRKPVTISPTSTIMQAAKAMMRSRVGSLLVVRRGKLLGIFTEGDLTCRVVARGLNPTKTRISTVMTTHIKSLEPDMDIYDALVCMNAMEVRHAPVMKNGELLGFLTQKDILKIQPDLFDLIVDRLQVREAKKKPIKEHELRLVE